MRTGPFSDPSVVTLINRYFVAYHMDNDFWTEARYGIDPGEENAYIVLETPDVDDVAKDVMVLDRLQQVLEPKNTRAAILEFLDKHSDLHQPWPALARLESDTSLQSRLERAEILLEEGRTEKALDLLRHEGLPQAHSAILRARAHRMDQRYEEAEALLAGLRENAPPKLAPDIAMETVRLAFDQDQRETAAELLDELIGPDLKTAVAAEAYWMRGWLHHLAGRDQRAIDTWHQGIERYPPHKALHSQKAYFTMIRMNWELPDNVDQPY